MDNLNNELISKFEGKDIIVSSIGDFEMNNFVDKCEIIEDKNYIDFENDFEGQEVRIKKSIIKSFESNVMGNEIIHCNGFDVMISESL